MRYHPSIDRLVLYDSGSRHRGVPGLFRLSSDLKRERFDGAILLQRAFEAALISFWARIPLRAGLSTDGRRLLLTHRVKADREIFDFHRVEHNLAVLTRMGIPGVGSELELPVGSREMNRAAQILDSAGIARDRLCFGLNPGAAFGSAKRWSPDRFAALSSRLARDYDAQGLIFGSRSEKELGDEICVMAPDARIVNLAGATTLEEALALIGLCGLFITNDSGLMHVAAALDVPLVSIFGPTNADVTSPWCERNRLIRKEGIYCSPCMKRECGEGHHLCMESISTDEVFEAARDLMGRYGADPPEKRRTSVVVSDDPVPILDFTQPPGR